MSGQEHKFELPPKIDRYLATLSKFYGKEGQRQLQEINFEIGKMETQLKSDKEIIQLREKIVRSAEAQMKNGVITSSDYLNEVTQLFESKITEKTHQIQLQLAKANHQIIKGI